MKNFVKENWYKLMVGSSMMMASFGFMIYAISPAYSNSNDHKVEIQTPQTPSAPVGTNGVVLEGYVYFVDGGYIYKNKNMVEYSSDWKNASSWEKYKLP
jgi:hypothetical protein